MITPEPDHEPDAACVRIVLLGMMGAGKTEVGGLLAQRLNMPFIDSDAAVEKTMGASVADIFAKRGEAAFRVAERAEMARLLSLGRAVIASGGGAFMDADTRALCEKNATTIWLKADAETLLARMKGTQATRPLLTKTDEFSTLLAAREPVYASADITIETADKTPNACVESICAALNLPGKEAHA